MATDALTGATLARPRSRIRLPGTLTRILKYILYRGVALLLTVVVGVYLTVLIVNMGGYLDTIRIAQIREAIGGSIRDDPQVRVLPAEEVRRIIDDQVAIEVQRLNLDQPFFLRSVNYLADALTLNLGRAEFMTSDTGSKQV